MNPYPRKPEDIAAQVEYWERAENNRRQSKNATWRAEYERYMQRQTEATVRAQTDAEYREQLAAVPEGATRMPKYKLEPLSYPLRLSQVPGTLILVCGWAGIAYGMIWWGVWAVKWVIGIVGQF